MICLTCGCPLAPMQNHDHKADNTGLDDGPPLGRQYRKPAPKPAAELADIRARAWATRRQKYGKDGHR